MAARIDQAGEERLARFESLRALAALGVLAGHAWGLHHAYGPSGYDTLPERLIYGGGYGVFVFFALSGYLLFRPLARAAFGAGERIDLAGYARNRALRILPLYVVVAGVLFVVEGGGGSPGEWLRFATFTQNFFSDTVLDLDAPMWSLIIEVQFYVLLPLAALGLAWVSRRRLGLAAAFLVVAGLAGVALRLWLLQGRDVTDPRVVYSLATTSFFFVPGMLLALARAREEPVRLPGVLGSSDAWAVASIAAWVFVLDRFNVEPLAAVASFLTVGALALPLRPGRLVGLLDARALAVVGVASYSLYLWHLPLVESVGRHVSTGLPVMFGVAVPLSIALALVSYRAVEAPFLRLRRRWARPGASVSAPRGRAVAPPALSPRTRAPSR